MKNTIKRFGIIAMVAIIGISMAAFSLTSCEGPEGPEGPQGPTGPLPRYVDAQGREVGVVLGSYGTNSDNYPIINKNGYTFTMTASGAFTFATHLYATGTNGTGTLYHNLLITYPNYILKNNGEYYRYKNRDADGYVTEIKSVSYASSRSDAGTWTNSSGTLYNSAELEKITEATDDAYFIGFTPEPPLRIVW